MTKKKNTLVNESIVRRWGKLANMTTLTESFIDTLEEEEEMEIDAAVEMDDDGEEEIMGAEVEMDDAGAEVQMSEEEAEVLVQAIADAISGVTGVDVDVEGEEEAADMEDAAMDMDAAADDLEDLADDEAAMGMGHKAYNRRDEVLNLEVVDDEELTEAVLQRVVERLLSRN